MVLSGCDNALNPSKHVSKHVDGSHEQIVVATFFSLVPALQWAAHSRVLPWAGGARVRAFFLLGWDLCKALQSRKWVTARPAGISPLYHVVHATKPDVSKKTSIQTHMIHTKFLQDVQGKCFRGQSIPKAWFRYFLRIWLPGWLAISVEHWKTDCNLLSAVIRLFTNMQNLTWESPNSTTATLTVVCWPGQDPVACAVPNDALRWRQGPPTVSRLLNQYHHHHQHHNHHHHHEHHHHHHHHQKWGESRTLVVF